MKIDHQSLSGALKKRGISLARALREAGVSPNAFFTLQRKNEILPRSLVQLARSLGLQPTEFLAEEEKQLTAAPPSIQSAIKRLKDFVRAQRGLLVMFGSRARGKEARAVSDWDFGYLGLHPTSIEDFAAAKAQAQEDAWPYSLDFVDLNRAPVWFVKSIEDDIVPLFQDWVGEETS